MNTTVETPVVPSPLTIEGVHVVKNAGHRDGGIYHIKGERLHLVVQGNAFTSCGINLLMQLSGAQYAKLDLLEPLLDMLKNFEDRHAGNGDWKAKRFLIQPHHRHVSGTYGQFVKALLERPECEKLHEYDNLAHSSDKQYLYMLAFK